MATHRPIGSSRIVCLSNVFDHHYYELRDGKIDRSLSASKRRNLFRCLQLATNREIIVLSAHPKALNRRKGRWLPALETRFDAHRQFFAPNWDVPKLRV